MSTPLPGILYRIQSVDFQTYIEMPNTTVGSPAELRPLKDVNRQQWYLEADTDSKFYIRSSMDSNLYLGYMNGAVCYHNKPNCRSFSFTRNDDGTFGFNAGINYYVCSTTDNRRVVYTAINSLDSQKWNFIPVTSGTPTGTAILPKGDYRIRALGGPFALTLSRTAANGSTLKPRVYVKLQDPPTQDDRGYTDHQRWHVARKANGRYTFQNSGGNLYMSSINLNSSEGDVITANATEFEWDIQSIGGSFWSIKLPISSAKEAGLSVGFADGQANNGDIVSLELSDLAKAQMWFFDTYVTLRPDMVQAEREVAAGVYVIHNCRTLNTFISAIKIGGNNGWEIVGETVHDSAAPVYKFKLQYVGDTPKFTLEYIQGPNLLDIPIKITAKSNILIADGTPSEFILIKRDGNAPGYFICPADSTKTAVSTRVGEDPYIEKKGLALDPRIEGDTSLMWLFK